MTNQEIINYIMLTPENTTPAILNEMLNELSGNGGSMVIRVNSDGSCDKTPHEVYEGLLSGYVRGVKEYYDPPLDTTDDIPLDVFMVSNNNEFEIWINTLFVDSYDNTVDYSPTPLLIGHLDTNEWEQPK